MVYSGLRKGSREIQVHTHQLEPLTQCCLMIVIFKLVQVLGHRVPTICLLEPDLSLSTLFANSVVSVIMDSIVRVRINFLSMVNLVICNFIVLRLFYLLEQIRFRLLSLWLLYQGVLLLIPVMAKIVFIILLHPGVLGNIVCCCWYVITRSL